MSETVGKPVSMAEVPTPPTRSRGRWAAVYEKIAGLRTGQALPIHFTGDAHAYYARAALRKLAKAAGERMLSNWNKPSRTMYFWLETKL